ncbi:glycoprotein [Wenzhou Rhinolophus pusillus ledantevirus 1]|uniref:glycoprotein n=1 Tax=Wenzhou Rhinolophus pusillus ledantevirus 1 TaxID=2929007 RepID=UPI0024819F00|nr:glycoprotein [Wenzhou Rhinolophus pusillus ledantevirus 1]UOX72917.1 glycoprotein [Wenzhou Rhinolophus pusillus ledantevirus 1]
MTISQLFLVLLPTVLGSLEDTSRAPVVNDPDGVGLTEMDNIILPISVGDSWKETSVKELKCPKHNIEKLQDGLTIGVFNMTRYDHFNPASVLGHLCHKTQWVTRCEYTWYFSKTVSRRIIPTLPTLQECETQRNLEINGIPLEGSYPPEECYWNSVNEEMVESVHLTEHKVGYDPYNGHFVDQIFLKGACDSSLCETDHSTVYWLKDPDVENLPECGELVVEEAELMTEARRNYADEFKDLVIYSHHIPKTSLKGACALKFCGDEGIQLVNGFWFKSPDWKNFKGSDVQRCPEGTTAKALPQGYFLDHIRFSIEELRDDMACLDALESIQVTGALSYRKLHYFHPKEAGVHPIYRLINGTLQSNTAKYVAAYTHWNTTECLGMLKSQNKMKCITWSDWIHVKDDLWQGFNGLMKDGNKMMIPWRYSADIQWNPEIHMAQYLTSAQHPFYQHISHQLHDEILDQLRKDRSANIGDSVAKAATSLWTRIIAFVDQIKTGIITVGVFVFTMILILTIRRCLGMRRLNSRKRGGKGKRKALQEIELTESDASFG